MRKKINKTPYLFFLLILPLLGSLYNILNSLTSNPIILLTKFDANIPFMPLFILPYLFWYVYILGYLVYLCYKDTIVYLITFIVIVFCELASFVIYYFIPTTVPRPTLEGDGVLIELVKITYAHDLPNNCFPSIHVLTSIAIMISCFFIKNKHIFHSIFILSSGMIIIISTLFIKQHVILDIFGSLILIFFIYGIVFTLFQYYFGKRMRQLFLDKGRKMRA
jgi:membrane-associated phospholipid phosphatase